MGFFGVWGRCKKGFQKVFCVSCELVEVFLLCFLFNKNEIQQDMFPLEHTKDSSICNFLFFLLQRQKKLIPKVFLRRSWFLPSRRQYNFILKYSHLCGISPDFREPSGGSWGEMSRGEDFPLVSGEKMKSFSRNLK